MEVQNQYCAPFILLNPFAGPDSSFNIFKKGYFWNPEHYGNMGCGVFKRGIQN